MISIDRVSRLFSILVLAFTFSSVSAQAGDPEGLTLYKEKKCNNCHALKDFHVAANKDNDEDKDSEPGEEKLDPPDLSKLSDEVLKQSDSAEFLQKFLKKKVEKQTAGLKPNKPHKHKKTFKGKAEELEKIVAFLLDHSKQKK